MRCMLDTNLCIDAMQHRLAELHVGIAKSQSARNEAALQQLLQPLDPADFDAAAAASYGRLRTTLERAGTPIGPLDSLIAALAPALPVPLVSHKLRGFAPVPGRKLVSWGSAGA